MCVGKCLPGSYVFTKSVDLNLGSKVPFSYFSNCYCMFNFGRHQVNMKPLGLRLYFAFSARVKSELSKPSLNSRLFHIPQTLTSIRLYQKLYYSRSPTMFFKNLLHKFFRGGESVTLFHCLVRRIVVDQTKCDHNVLHRRICLYNV